MAAVGTSVSSFLDKTKCFKVACCELNDCGPKDFKSEMSWYVLIKEKVSFYPFFCELTAIVNVKILDFHAHEYEIVQLLNVTVSNFKVANVSLSRLDGVRIHL